jgi:hypothetical protein
VSSGINRTREVVRVNDDESLSQRINFLGSQFEDNAAFIQQVQTAYTSADEALAEQLTTLSSEFDDNMATTLQDYLTKVDAESARAALKTAIQSDYDGAIATALTEYETASEAGSARASMQTTIEAKIPDAAAIQEATASSIEDNNRAMIGYCTVDGSIANADSPSECSALGGEWLAAEPLAETVKGLQIVDNNGDSANVEQRMRSYRDELGKLNSEYTVKVQTDVDGNSIVGGFGIATDSGTGTVQAGFDVDQFWVGRLGQKTFPFIIDSDTGETFIDEAVIESLTFNKLRADDGSVIIENGKLKASFIEADNIVTRQMQSSSNVTVGGSTGPAFDFNTDGSFSLRGKDSTGGVIQDTEGTRVYDSNGTLRVKLGKL